MKRLSVVKKLSFQSKLEKISSVAEYFALSVPLKVSQALGKRGPVSVSAPFNSSDAFPVNLFPVGGGRHYIRVKAKIRVAANIKGGDRVRVRFTVLDPNTKVSIPKDVAKALQAAKLLEGFKALPRGMLTYALRKISDAAKPETRKKRIQDAAEIVRKRKART